VVAEGSAVSEAARPAAEVPAEAGRRNFMTLSSTNHGSTKHDGLLNEFVAKLRAAAQDNLVSLILYGSAAEGEFHAEYSDLNLLCVVRDTSYPALSKICAVVDWWRKKKHHPPLVLTAKELTDTADVFSIEFMDIKLRYRILYGEDPLRDLNVPTQLHRQQLEYELREKLFLLRQHLLLAGTSEKALWEVMLHSLSSFTTLFRHVLLELGEQRRKHSREATQDLATRLNFDASAFVELMDVRAQKLDRNQLQPADVARRYLLAIETVASAVDTMQSSSMKTN
jgi:predicted nucleotidyltransferase